jgi:hypothetical protein
LNAISKISEPIARRSTVMPDAPISGKTVLANADPVWMDSMAMISSNTGNRTEFFNAEIKVIAGP